MGDRYLSELKVGDIVTSHVSSCNWYKKIVKIVRFTSSESFGKGVYGQIIFPNDGGFLDEFHDGDDSAIKDHKFTIVREEEATLLIING